MRDAKQPLQAGTLRAALKKKASMVDRSFFLTNNRSNGSSASTLLSQRYTKALRQHQVAENNSKIISRTTKAHFLTVQKYKRRHGVAKGQPTHPLAMGEDRSEEPASQGDEKQRSYTHDVATDKLKVMALIFCI